MEGMPAPHNFITERLKRLMASGEGAKQTTAQFGGRVTGGILLMRWAALHLSLYVS